MATFKNEKNGNTFEYKTHNKVYNKKIYDSELYDALKGKKATFLYYVGIDGLERKFEFDDSSKIISKLISDPHRVNGNEILPNIREAIVSMIHNIYEENKHLGEGIPIGLDSNISMDVRNYHNPVGNDLEILFELVPSKNKGHMNLSMTLDVDYKNN